MLLKGPIEGLPAPPQEDVDSFTKCLKKILANARGEVPVGPQEIIVDPYSRAEVMTGGGWSMYASANFRGSFSAVSTPIFASKYSLFSISDLQELHSGAPFENKKMQDVCQLFMGLFLSFRIFREFR